MLGRLISSLADVRRATTAEELGAIRRFRYRVYVHEFGRSRMGGVDHGTGEVRLAGDEGPGAIQLYTGTLDKMTAHARLVHWAPGTVPAERVRTLQLDRIPGWPDVHLVYVGPYAIAQAHRGNKLLLAALLRRGYELVCRETPAQLMVATCAPGLVGLYHRIGMRPYTPELSVVDMGLVVPLLGVMSDVEHLRRVRSPLGDLAKRFFGRGKTRPVDVAAFHQLFESAGLVSDPAVVWSELETLATQHQAGPASFLARLSPELAERLSSAGLIVGSSPGRPVTTEGIKQREMFVVLEGAFEVRTESGGRIATLGPGDVFGEIGFFADSGLRTAAVVALTEGRVLMIRRRFMRELERQDPSAAAAMYRELARVMAERLAGVLAQRGGGV